MTSGYDNDFTLITCNNCRKNSKKPLEDFLKVNLQTSYKGKNCCGFAFKRLSSQDDILECGTVPSINALFVGISE